MIGNFILTVYRVEFLNSYPYSGKRDTYCTLRIGKNSASTQIAENGGKYPHWNQNFLLHLKGAKELLSIEVHEANKKMGDTLRGQGFIDFNYVTPKYSGFWIEIYDGDRQVGSAILLIRGIEEAKVNQKLALVEEENEDKIVALPISQQNNKLNEIKELKKQEVRELQDITNNSAYSKQEKKGDGLEKKGLKQKIVKLLSFSKSSKTRPQSSKYSSLGEDTNLGPEGQSSSYEGGYAGTKAKSRELIVFEEANEKYDDIIGLERASDPAFENSLIADSSAEVSRDFLLEKDNKNLPSLTSIKGARI